MKNIALVKKYLGISLIILGLILILLANFYWTKYRPMMATKDCAKVAQTNLKSLHGIQDVNDLTKIYTFLMDRCLSVGYGISK